MIKSSIQSLAVVSLMVLLLNSCQYSPQNKIVVSENEYDMTFDALASRWDEAIPLGNGMLGALIWNKEGKLRISLDRADLWDLRPMGNIGIKEWNFNWVYEQWESDNYHAVQELFDKPYNQSPAPTKIPGAALEFDIAPLGEIRSVRLFSTYSFSWLANLQAWKFDGDAAAKTLRIFADD